MIHNPLVSEALPLFLVIASQMGLGITVTAIDMANGTASPDALYVFALQSLIAAVYLAVRLFKVSRERLALALASGSPLSAELPDPATGPSIVWRSFVEIQRREAERVIAFQSESAREEMEAFTFAVHAMKTPVLALSLLADRAERTGEPLRPLDVKLESEELDRLLELALGKMRLGDFERDSLIEKVSLKEIVSSSVRKARRLFIARGISLDICEGDCEVESDKKWLGFIMDQLVVNAAKYARSAVRIWIVKGESSFTLTIDDNGPGIPLEDRMRLFSRSFTGTIGRTADSGGTPSSGYGLHLASLAAIKLGVKLSLKDNEGRGTRASVEIPLSRSLFLRDSGIL